MDNTLWTGFQNTLIPRPAFSRCHCDGQCPLSHPKNEDSKIPNGSSKQIDIQHWVDRRGIKYDSNATNANLLHVVAMNKPETKFITDTIAPEYGHVVQRLPPFHCELNPIELTWGQEKKKIAKNNTFNINDVKELYLKAKSMITKEVWEKSERHVIEHVENELWKTDVQICPIIVDLQDDDDDVNDFQSLQQHT